MGSKFMARKKFDYDLYDYKYRYQIERAERTRVESFYLFSEIVDSCVLFNPESSEEINKISIEYKELIFSDLKTNHGNNTSILIDRAIELAHTIIENYDNSEEIKIKFNSRINIPEWRAKRTWNFMAKAAHDKWHE